MALVIEDEPGIASFAVAAFRRFGFDSFAVETVVDAIEILEQSVSCKAIFVHLQNESDQRALVATVSARWPSITIILLSPRLDSLRDLPPSIFLTEPAAPATIIAVIRRLAVDSGDGARGEIH